MHIKIKRTPSGHVVASAQDDEYDRVDATELLKYLALHDSEETDDDIMCGLHRYLTSGRAPKGSLGFSELDGLMTAVTASRNGVCVFRWMPSIWGGAVPAFESMEEARTVFAAMARRCRQISGQLQLTGTNTCVFDRAPTGEVSAGAWCRGFMRGLMITPEQWKPAFEHELARRVLLPIATIAADERAWALFDSENEQEPWCGSPDVVIADGCSFDVGALIDVWSELRASAATDGSPTGISSAEDEEDGNATPSPGSAVDRARADEVRERLHGLMKRAAKH